MNILKYLPVVAIFAFSSALNAAETFVSHYEPLHDVTMQMNDRVHASVGQNRMPAALGFEALGQRFDLDLEPNDRVLSALPANAAFAGVSVYRGRLQNKPKSWVRIVMFEGMPRGLIWDGQTMFAIEAPGDSAVTTSEPVMYKLADLNIVPGTMSCGVKSISGSASKVLSSMSAELHAAAAQSAGAVSEITMSVIGDSLFTTAQGGDAPAAAAITARFNNIDGYFSEQVGVQLNVQLIDIFDSATDPFDNTLDSSLLLDQLSEHRLQTPAHNSLGLTHLYTGRNFDTSTVGVAWRGALCSNYFSAGVSEGRAGLTTDSLIAAHEIGHNFGAEHDGQAGSSCESHTDPSIMSPSVTGSNQFSACSITVMQAEAAAASCVVALPAVDVGIRLINQSSTVLLGANTVLEYEVSANGTVGVTGVVADFALPPVLSLDSITTSSGTCSSGAGTASCALGDLSGLSTHSITITTTPTGVGGGTLSASVTTPDTDERPINDQEVLQLTVDPAVDLVVNTPATSPVFVDTSTTVTATISNLSILDASNVSLSITLGGGLQADSASWSIGTCTVAAQQVDCQANSLSAQSSSSLSISATATSLGSKNVSISVSSAEADADVSNNSASGAVNVVSEQGEEDGGGGATSLLFLLLLALSCLLARSTCRASTQVRRKKHQLVRVHSSREQIRLRV